MTSSDDLDRRLTAWLDERVAPMPPDDLDKATTERIAGTRQLPAWATTERWIPMETRARFGAAPRAIIVFVILAILTAFTAATIAIGASSGPKLPPPFGAARNGLIALAYGGDLYVVEPDGSDRRLILSGLERFSDPSWSRDGTRLAFVSTPTDGGDPSLRAIDPDGSDPIVLATAADADFAWIEWSADSREIMYSAIVPELVGDGCFQSTADGRGCGSRFFVVPVDGSERPRQVGDPTLDARGAALSPDGVTVAFGGGEASSEALYLMDWDGSDARELHGIGEGTRGWAFVQQSWSPDGRSVVTHDDGLGPQRIWLVDVDGSEPIQLSLPGSDQFWPQWSPDGATIGWDGPITMTLWDVDGDQAPRTPAGPTADLRDWSPDGQRFLAANAGDLVVYDLEGDVMVVLGPTDDGANSGSWQRVAIDAG